ncbi:hypothetical protein JL101_029015 (plasmid) [Skermanella rosea]|uniref:hypothetical protein n=1 Tax=Skermanella rosea TaxID=1817965 RepID=UPI00193123E9|nr:hypothetical protein [Skermanella rosea]UEM07045.1 hypothetical protein JL101_029015 [Skermanella rosea]
MAKCLALGLFAAALTSTCAQAVPITGFPLVSVTIDEPAPGTVISTASLSEPTVVERSAGGGIASGRVSAIQGTDLNRAFGGVQGSVGLDLTGTGFAQVTLDGKVRTTVTLPADQQGSPFSAINIGPNTVIDLHELDDVRYSLAYRLSILYDPGGPFERELRMTNRFECVQSGERRCPFEVFDYNSDPNPFLPAPGGTSTLDMSLSYTVTLESLDVPEPAPATLVIVALAFLGLGRRSRQPTP